MMMYSICISAESVKQNSDRQFELLCRGIGLLRDSGHATLIYSTCALSDLENDGVSGQQKYDLIGTCREYN